MPHLKSQPSEPEIRVTVPTQFAFWSPVLKLLSQDLQPEQCPEHSESSGSVLMKEPSVLSEDMNNDANQDYVS